jgi:TPR repeat protein
MLSGAHRRLTAPASLGMTAILLMSAASVVTGQSTEKPSTPSATAPAAAQSADEAYRKGQDFEKKQNYTEAMRWYRAAAAQGNARAQFGIGNLYTAGEGVAKDYSEALRWFRLAAAQGDSLAQGNVGFFYMVGWGVKIDYAEGMRWSRMAADQGNEVAQRNIGFMYFKGLGVAADRAEAIRWWRKAAAQGDDDAKEALKELGEK